MNPINNVGIFAGSVSKNCNAVNYLRWLSRRPCGPVAHLALPLLLLFPLDLLLQRGKLQHGVPERILSLDVRARRAAQKFHVDSNYMFSHKL